MTEGSLELLNSSAVGRYWAHSFFIRMHSLADLRLVEGDATPGAVPAQVHEYVHYLHNVSSSAGLHLFVANLWLLRSLPHCTNNYGHVARGAQLSEEAQHWLTLAGNWSRALWGRQTWLDCAVKPNRVTTWRYGVPRRFEERLTLPNTVLVIDKVAIDVEAIPPVGTAVHGTIEIGYDFISEGVAYEVEREVYCANGAAEGELERTTPSYPYLAYHPLVDHLVGRDTTSRERIALGTYALLTSSPAATLVDMCADLGRQAPMASDTIPDSVTSAVIDPFRKNAMNSITQMLLPELDRLGHGGPIAGGASEIGALFRAGFALRTINPNLEHNFIGGRIDGSTFLRIVGGLIDCCVLQEKSDDRGQFGWIGPGIAATDERGTQQLATLQAAIHFASLHTRWKHSLTATADLPATRCPYSGACHRELEDGLPSACQTNPWTRFMDAPSGQPVCWYAAGVKALARRARM